MARKTDRLRLPVVASLPSGTLGDVVVLSTDGRAYTYNGLAWVSGDQLGNTYEYSLPTDVTNIITPNPNRLAGGSFVADAATVTLSVEVSASIEDAKAANAEIEFWYGDAALVSPPIIQNSQVTGPRANTTRIIVGGIAAYPATTKTEVKLTGLTAGHTYNWEISGGIVGYATLLPLPDTPQAIGVSDAVTVPGATAGVLGDRILAITSATKLHVMKQNHYTSVQDTIMTGSGMPLVSGRTGGQVAVSPNGSRIAVTNYNLNTVSVYDIASVVSNGPGTPSLVATVASTPSPYAVVWSDNDTFWIADLFVIGHIQKFTGASGASPTAASALTLDGTIVQSIFSLQITPDNSKLLVAGSGSNSKVYTVATATNTITSVTVPSGTGGMIGPLDNLTALVHYGAGPSMAVLTFSSMTFGTGVTNAAWATANVLMGFNDAKAALLILGVADTTRFNVRHIIMPASGATTALTEYVAWSAVGTPVCACTDDHGNIYVCTSNGNLSQWFGGVFHIRPTWLAFFGEKLIVRVTPAH